MSRIKSNHFYQNLGTDARTCASNSNLRKSSRKRRMGNSSNTGRSQNRNSNKNYYTQGDKDIYKKGTNSYKVLADITDNRYKKSNNKISSSRKHWESTKASDAKNLYYDDLPNGNINQRSIHRNLLMKHSHIMNNGSQTTRNYPSKF